MYKKLLALFLLIGWISHGYATTQYITPKKSNRVPLNTAKVIELPPFSAISVTGPTQLFLTCRQPNQRVAIFAPPQKAALVNVAVQNHMLMIDPHLRDDQTPVLIKVSMSRPLDRIEARGTANIQAQSCGNPNLVLVAKDAASIRLKGNNRVRAIQNDSTRTITVENIGGNNFLLGSNQHGKIVLSGKTDELNTRLEGSAFLDARHLQARSAHILTRDVATAYVSVTEALYGFAYDYSNIFYYGRPERVMKENRGSGDVLAVKPLTFHDK